MLRRVPAPFLVLHLALLALCAGTPWRLGRDRPDRARSLLGLTVVVLLPLQLAATRWPSLLAATGWADVVFVSQLYVPLAALAASAALRAQPAGRARVRTAVLAAALVGCAVAATSLPLRAPRRIDRPLRVKDGVVLQSAPSSCGAAAAATLVRALGVDATATEADLATLCLTRPDRGTSDLGLFRGLSRACPDRRVRFASPTLDALRARTSPCLVSVGLDPSRVADPLRTVLREECGWDEGVLHAVVLFDLDERRAVIGDPRFGREEWSLEHFVALWDGTALVVE